MSGLALPETAPAQSHSAESLNAAEHIAPHLSRLRKLVLDTLTKHGDGLTDEQLVYETGLEPNTLRPRRVELVRLGYVRESGATRRTRSGLEAAVWRVATDDERRAYWADKSTRELAALEDTIQRTRRQLESLVREREERLKAMGVQQ